MMSVVVNQSEIVCKSTVRGQLGRICIYHVK